jgi:hypothetical protein
VSPDSTSSGGGIIGRERELAILRSHLAAVADAGAALVVVTGEPGVGKTTLLDQLCREARASGHRVIRGEADEHRRSAFGLWTGPRVQLALPTDGGSGDPDERRWAVLDDLREAFGGDEPTLVVLDDVQWADEPSRWVLEHLPGAVDGPVLLVAGGRDPASTPSARPLRAANVVALDGFGPDEIALLVRQVDPMRTDLDPEAVRRRTGGNPLFVRELVAAPPTAELPAEVGPLLRATLDRLPPSTPRATSELAVAGDDAPAVVLAGALGIDATELTDAFAPAIAANVLLAGGLGQPRFRPALLREAALDRLEPGDRRDLAEGIAASWDRSGVGLVATVRAASARLTAVPALDAAVAAGDAGRAAEMLVASGDAVGAVGLLAEASEVLDAFAPHERSLRVRLLLQRGDALDAIGDRLGAAEAFATAAHAAPGAGAADDVEGVEPTLTARAVLGVDRHRLMYDDDPTRLVTLREAEAMLPPGDHPVRVGLLGRIGVALAVRPGLRDDAGTASREAVAMARRLGDPVLVVDALIDRYLSPRTPGELRDRTDAAAELAAMAEPAGRPDLVQVAAEWEFSGATMDGDLTRAERVCERLEVAAAVAASPARTFAAILRRAGLDSLAGNHDRALQLATEVRRVGLDAVPAAEAAGVEEGVRSVIALNRGRPDDALAELHARVTSEAVPLQLPFFQVHTAMTDLILGDVDAATGRIQRWAPVVTDPTTGPEVPSTLANLATAVAELGLTEHASGLRARLEPFTGLGSLEFGLVYSMPVDTLLARLDLLVGDAAEAVRHAAIGVAVADRSGSPVWRAWSSWFLAEACAASGDHDRAVGARAEAHAAAARGDVLLPSAATDRDRGDAPRSATDRTATVRRVATGWRIESPLGSATVPASRGLDQLVRVLVAGPEEVSAIDLTGAPEAPVAADLGPALDATAKRAYRRRLAELADEIAAADRIGDAARSTRAHEELEAIHTELRRAVGLGGRDRPNASGSERARVNVTRSLRRAVDAVAAAAPDLGAHLEVSIRTGGSCSYRPDPAVTLCWKVVEPASDD